MKTRAVLSALALSLIFSFPTYALDTRCEVVGPAASELSAIAREAANAQMQADELEAYLRSNGSADWRYVAYKMDYLRENVRNLQKRVNSFVQSEPKLNAAQNVQLERLEQGVATLTVFVNNTTRIIGSRQVLPHRNVLMSNARAMSVRADIIRDAARNLRIAESA